MRTADNMLIYVASIRALASVRGAENDGPPSVRRSCCRGRGDDVIVVEVQDLRRARIHIILQQSCSGRLKWGSA
eukprot:8845954-Pyramimonas_sp.AAC.1